MKRFLPLLLFGFVCFGEENPYKETAKKEIISRLKVQTDIAKPSDIIDGKFVAIGAKPPKATITRSIENEHVVYRFATTERVNRIELNTCFATETDVKNLSEDEVQALKATQSLYHFCQHGHYGDTVTYQWQTRFPEKMRTGKGGIFAQIHGRPDRTLVKTPQGKLKRLSNKDFITLLANTEFKKNIGYDRTTDKPNGWRVEQSAGGPIMALHFHDDFMYMLIRSDAHRQSDPSIKIRPKPHRDLNKRLGEKGKFATIPVAIPTEDVPINQWIDFKLRIHYSTYDPNDDKALSSGRVELWIDDEKVVNWRGYVGKNDRYGPFFKFGIYKSRIDGFKVDFRDYREQIEP